MGKIIFVVQAAALIFFLCLAETRAALASPVDTMRAPVRNIFFIGNFHTTEKTMLREMTFKKGDTISVDAIIESQQRIYNIGLFNSVEVTPALDTVAGMVDIYVLVSERWYIWPQIILGVKDRDWTNIFSHGSKLFGGLGIMDFNVRGQREKLFVGGVLGYDPYASLEYSFLTLDEGRDFFLDASVGTSRTLNQSDTQYTDGYGFNELRYNGAVEVTYRASAYLNITAHAEVQALHLSNPNARLTLNPSGTDIAPTVYLLASYDSRDNVEYPTSGTYASASISKTGAGTFINYGRGAFDLRKYFLLFGGVSLDARAAAGAMFGGDVPVYVHQFLGLDERIRGEWSDKREGEDLAIGSLELRIPILSPRIVTWTAAPEWFPSQFATGRIGIYGTLFADAGNVWFRDDKLSDTRWSNGVGAGINILFSYGIVARFEYAFHGNINGGQFIFDVGAAF